MNNEIQEVAIKDIVCSSDFQVRAGLNARTVTNYTMAYKSGAVFPPVTIAKLDGKLILVDGFHRVEALKALGRESVRAEVVQTNREGAFKLAAGGNRTHGLPLKRHEVRRAFRFYMKGKQYLKGRSGHKSYEEIALELGGTRHLTTIRNWMHKDFPGTAQRLYSRDGAEWEITGKRKLTQKERLTRTAYKALREFEKASSSVQDPHERGCLIQEVEGLLQTLKQEGEYTPWEEPPF